MGRFLKLFGGAFLGSFLFFGLIFNLTKNIFAAQSINSVTLDGLSAVSVGPSASISMLVNVTTSGGGGSNNWESTSYQIGSNPVICVDTPDYTNSGTFQETINITSPSVNGTYNLVVSAYQGGGCNGANGSTTLNNSITVSGGTDPNPDPSGNGNSGAIWTTDGTCGTSQQNLNVEYDQGDHVFINGENFDPNTQYSWTIEGLPGNASGDPNQVVASGNNSSDSSGNFCFDAYTVALDDCGEYNVTFGNKGDNYHISISCSQASGSPTPSPTPTAPPTGSPSPSPTTNPQVLACNNINVTPSFGPNNKFEFGQTYNFSANITGDPIGYFWSVNPTLPVLSSTNDPTTSWTAPLSANPGITWLLSLTVFDETQNQASCQIEFRDPDTDVCANIDGNQTSVPNGLHLDASGRNCVSFEFGGPGGSGGGGGSVLGTSTTSGQVLGATTTAKAGVAEDVIGTLLVVVGLSTTLTSAYAYRKAFSRA